MLSSVSGLVNSHTEVEERLERAWQRVRDAQRIVVKIGSNLLTTNGKGLRSDWIADRCREIAVLKAQGRQVVVVTSGATAAGTPRLGLRRPPASLREQQAAATAGMGVLLNCYESGLAPHGIHVGQILITRDDVHNRRRYLNARDTLDTLLKLGLVPVVNENDTVMVEELKFGDNDTLSANVADLVGADLLILLSDVEGLFNSDPRVHNDARLISLVEQVTPEIEKLAGGVGSTVARGGMATKLKAAKMASRSGCAMVLTNGFRDDPISEVLGQVPIGTLFLADNSPLNARKSWIANARVVEGRVVLDAGAVRALVSGKSLLARGVIEVHGDFDRGATILCLDTDGQTSIAKGAVNYDAGDLKKIIGLHSREFESILGYLGDEEVIHRDAMVGL